MQIKAFLLLISLLIALSSIGTVSADTGITPSLTDPPLDETPIVDTPIVDTPIVDTPIVETPLIEANQTEILTKNSVETPENIMDNAIKTTPTSPSSENIAERKIPTIIGTLTEPNTITSVTNVAESTKPIKEPELPSAALASGIFMVIGGIMLPKNQ